MMSGLASELVRDSLEMGLISSSRAKEIVTWV
jgi:hypothetical protein